MYCLIYNGEVVLEECHLHITSRTILEQCNLILGNAGRLCKHICVLSFCCLDSSQNKYVCILSVYTTGSSEKDLWYLLSFRCFIWCDLTGRSCKMGGSHNSYWRPLSAKVQVWHHGKHNMSNYVMYWSSSMHNFPKIENDFAAFVKYNL